MRPLAHGHPASECSDGWRAWQGGSECILSILLWNREETGLWADSSTCPRVRLVGDELLEAFKSGSRYSLSEGPGSFIASAGNTAERPSAARSHALSIHCVISSVDTLRTLAVGRTRGWLQRTLGVHVPRAGCSGLGGACAQGWLPRTRGCMCPALAAADPGGA